MKTICKIACFVAYPFALAYLYYTGAMDDVAEGANN